jgi:CheY-like chemotaxis protein/HPt (histidine-containing phosphotransfer) domain-containing protein
MAEEEGGRRRLRLLVADDVLANQAVLKALLGSAGHVVECVGDGALAVAAVAQAAAAGRPFDGVLMDVMMPGTNGLDATRQIRGLPGKAAKVPILAVTASAFPEDIRACRQAGMNGHLTKPIIRDALVEALHRLAEPDGAEAPDSALDRELEQQPLLLHRSGGSAIPGLDAELARELAPEFLAEIRSALAGLREVTPGGHVPFAHRLAGAAATLGAARLTMAARRLQASQPGSGEAAELIGLVAAIGEATLEALAPTVAAGQAA